ncbi:MAG: hypothetical protein NUV88_02585 [Candidatus Kaiserbacteria bacterium]|nr:hypothetical protein [Candidatus Kaiserbacteria bacterium]
MTNVLPKESLENVWTSYRSRLILVGSVVFLAIAFLAHLALLPAYIALRIEKSAQNQSAVVPAPPDTNPQDKANKNDITRAKALLTGITPIVSASSSPTEAIGVALSLRPKGVTLESINFVSGQNGSITLIGDSAGREGINQYREALSKGGYFKSVSVPVGALVGSEGGKFTLTLTGNF